MTTRVLFWALLLASLSGCAKDPQCVNEYELGTVAFMATQSNAPFSGALEIYPCVVNTSTYFGNYVNNAISPINPSYIISNGAILSSGVPLLLPVGETYTMLYWGVDNSSSHPDGISIPGPIGISTNLADTYWSLKQNTGTLTYTPAYNQVMTVKNITIGMSEVVVPLKRAVAGLNVIITNKDGIPFANEITGFIIRVGSISKDINYMTGEADPSHLVTVEFPLTISEDRTRADSPTAMLYPSSASPLISIIARLADNSKKTHVTNLANAFVAGEVQTVNVTINKIITGPSAISEFSVSDWTETSQSIEINNL